MAVQTDIRVLIPMVRRGVEGVVPVSGGLTDEQIRDLVADALADIVLYTGSAFGHTLLVTQLGAGGAPEEYATDDALTLAQQRVVSAQAALNHFFHTMVALKSQETIRDESTEWSYTTSANSMRDAWKALIEARDKALASLEGNQPTDTYISFLHERDSRVAAFVEPFFEAAGVGGINQDWRFQ